MFVDELIDAKKENHKKFHAENEEFASELLKSIPESLSTIAKVKYINLYKEDVREANQYLLDARNQNITVSKLKSDIRAEHEEIKIAARIITSDFMRTSINLTKKLAVKFTETEMGMKIPGRTFEIKFERCCCEKFWRRTLRKQVRQEREKSHLKIAPEFMRYCSNDAVNESESQDSADNEFRKAYKAESESGELFELPSLEESIINKKNELWTRAKGIGDLAKKENLEARLITLTCPSKFHATRTFNKTVVRNKKYENLTPAESHKHLNDCWKKTRALLAKKKIKPMFIVTVEPHKNGTAHWHVVMFAKESEWSSIEKTLLNKFLKDHNPEESGAAIRRVKIDKVKNGVEGAIAYATKYILKHTAGIEGEKAETDRVVAWRRSWGVRAFRFSHDAATVYRLMRKRDFKAEELIDVQEAAKDGEYAKFLTLYKESEAKTEYEDTKNKYGEESKKFFGILINEKILRRTEKWKLTRVKVEKERENLEKVTVNIKEPSKSKSKKDNINYAKVTHINTISSRLKRTSLKKPPSPSGDSGALLHYVPKSTFRQ